MSRLNNSYSSANRRVSGYPLSQQLTIAGKIDKVFFAKPSWCAGVIHVTKGNTAFFDIIRFAGACCLEVGQQVKLRGKFVNDPKWGEQFVVESQVYEMPADASGLAHWLKVWAGARGIGETRAKRIAEKFGDKFEAALGDPAQREQMADVAGVDLEMIEALAEEWSKNSEFCRLATRLAAYELTHHQIKVLYGKLGGGCVEQLQTNPYRLMREIEGFGFLRLDAIAQKFGIPKDHPGRISAAVQHTVVDAMSKDGWTCVTGDRLLQEAIRILRLDNEDAVELIAKAVAGEVTEGNLRQIDSPDEGGKTRYAMNSAYRHEIYVFDRLARGREPNAHFAARETAVADVISGIKPAPDESQADAIRMALESQICIISGGAGVGKTYICGALAKVYKSQGLRVKLCAPTGKAARRIEQLCGHAASTIHRLLEYTGGSFGRNTQKPIEADLVIVDELSMVDMSLAYHLLRAIAPGTAVVMVGDHHQLPPVGAGSLLRDCIQNQIVPVKILEHCHRQAGILKHSCNEILEGTVLQTWMQADGTDGSGAVAAAADSRTRAPSPWMVNRKLNTAQDVLDCIDRLFTTIIPAWGFDPLRDTQFLGPIKRGDLGTWSINQRLQRLWQTTEYGVRPEDYDASTGRFKLYVGDKVICTRNNYDLNVMNGHLGIVVESNPRSGILCVDFADGTLALSTDSEQNRPRRVVTIPRDFAEKIELAYCLTTHKMQGSECPCVVSVCHSMHGFFLHRNWVYTSCTRARETSCILGDNRGIEQAARTVKVNDRLTLLPVFSRGCVAADGDQTDERAGRDDEAFRVAYEEHGGEWHADDREDAEYFAE